MNTVSSGVDASKLMAEFPSLSAAHRRTLEAIFRHPAAHNLEWRHVIGLIADIGQVHEKSNGEFEFAIAGKRHHMRGPHSKDLTSEEVTGLRHFLVQKDIATVDLPGLASSQQASAPNLLVAVDHHGTKIFQVDISSGDENAHVINPYDPHHFLFHLTHKDQSRERGQRAPEEPAYYEAIAKAIAPGGKIAVAGHGTGKSNAAHHLIEYLKSHHADTYRRVVREIDADLSSMTAPQLLDLARQALQGREPVPALLALA